MRFAGNTQRYGLASIAGGAVLLCAGQALALGCADIPGATVDPGLLSFIPYQSYGRLLPIFKSAKLNKENRHSLVVDRMVGQQLQLPDGKGHLWLSLTGTGGTQITGDLGEHSTPEPLAGLGNAGYHDQLAGAFAANAIEQKSFNPPPLQSVDTSQLQGRAGITRIAQTTQELIGKPEIASTDAVTYACSPDASFVGDPGKLSTIVVLKGTIRATQTTTTTTTAQILRVTVNDVVRQRQADYAELAALVAGIPELAAGLAALQNPPPPAVAAEPAATASAQDAAAEPVDAGRPSSEQATTSAPPQSPARINWASILNTLGILCAIVLLLLFHPRFTARNRHGTPQESETILKPEAAVVPKDEEAGGKLTSGADRPGKTLEARIAVLETLRIETGQFQQKLSEAMATAASDAADTERTRKQLTEVETQLGRATKARIKLEEAAQDDRSKFNAARDEARKLKELAVDLKLRLAKAMGQLESSQSIMTELESASEMAIELNADYRSKLQNTDGENRAMRSRIDLLEASLAERDDLLKTTIQTSEEIRKALMQERAGRLSIESDFSGLSKDFEIVRQDSTAESQRLKAELIETRHELAASVSAVASLRHNLDAALYERKQLELDHQAKRTETARLRVDYGVKAKLLQNNVSELSAHIENLEQLLRDSNIEAPQFAAMLLGAAVSQKKDAVEDSSGDDDDAGNVVQLRVPRTERG